MPAYMILTRDQPVRDPAEMAEYQRLTREAPPTVPLKPLAIYGETVALEGPAPDGALVIEFATVEDAQAWYNSPAYQKALPHRLAAADCRVFIVQGL